MEFGHEYDNVVRANFEANRRKIAVENSPFGPIQKYGEAIMKDSVETVSDLASSEFDPNKSLFGQVLGIVAPSLLTQDVARITDREIDRHNAEDIRH